MTWITGGLGRLRLATKMVLMALFVTLTSSVAFAVVSYLHARDHDRQTVLDRLEQTASYAANRLIEVQDLLEADSFQLSIAQTTTTLVTRLGPDGRVPPTAANDRLMRRLEQDFVNLMTVRSSYAQIRLIGRADNWTEMVRVNRDGQDLVPVRGAALQSKDDEPYLARIDDSRPGDSYYHRVTYNRELGRIDGPPMLRLVRPLFDADGLLIGALVINTDFEALLEWSVPLIPPDTRLIIRNSDLDYMVFEKGTASPSLVFREQGDWQPPDHIDPVVPFETLDQVGDFAFMDRQVAFHHLPIHDFDLPTDASLAAAPGPVSDNILSPDVPASDMPFRIGLIAEYPRDLMHSGAHAALSRSIVTGGLLALVTVALSLALGTRILLPLTRLSEQIRARTDRTQPLSFASTSQDEVGELARELTTMSNELIRETRRLDSILMTAADGIVAIDDDGHIVTANIATQALFGYAQDELIGQPISLLMFDDDAAQHPHFVRNANEQAGPRRMAADRVLFGRRKDGSSIAIEISISSAYLGDKRHFTGVIRDVTERRQAQQRQEELVRNLEQSNAELDQFAYIASHDLKAPLRVIDNASRWLEEDLAQHLDEDTRDSMELLRSRARRMERLLDDLLQHSRIGRIAQPTTLVTGAELIQEIRDLAGPPEAFTLDAAPKIDAIEVLRLPLQTVLLNLVSNAIKHHDRAHAHVRIDLEETDAMLIFSIIDDGPGIPPAYHAKVFELFQTLLPRDKVDSSGMGLAMVRKHVDLAGGKVELISDGRRGTTFRLHWPKSGIKHEVAAA